MSRCKANPCCSDPYNCTVPLPQDRTGLYHLNEREIDNDGVDNFSVAMKAKLGKKRSEGRGGWQDKDQCSADFLSQLLREHVEKGDPVDVANLAMMLHQRGERIL